MKENYSIKDAFKELEILTESEAFRINNEQQRQALDKFMQGDELDDIEMIVDLEAESEEEVKDSYVGNVIIECPVCKSKFYKNKEDIIEDEEQPEYVNVDEECASCGSAGGFVVIGEVAPYNTQEEVEDEEQETEPSVEDEENIKDEEQPVDEEEVEETSEEPTEGEENTEDEEDLEEGIAGGIIGGIQGNAAGKAVGQAVGTAAGAAIGNAIAPGIGTAVGAALGSAAGRTLGGAAGSLAGGAAGSAIQNKINQKDTQEVKECRKTKLKEFYEPLKSFKTFQYLNKTKQDWTITKIYHDLDDDRLHVIGCRDHRAEPDYYVGLGYTPDGGHWNQGWYDFRTFEDAEKALKAEYNVEEYIHKPKIEEARSASKSKQFYSKVKEETITTDSFEVWKDQLSDLKQTLEFEDIEDDFNSFEELLYSNYIQVNDFVKENISNAKSWYFEDIDEVKVITLNNKVITVYVEVDDSGLSLDCYIEEDDEIDEAVQSKKQLRGKELAQAFVDLYKEAGDNKTGPFGEKELTVGSENEVIFESQMGQEIVYFNEDGSIKFVVDSSLDNWGIEKEDAKAIFGPTVKFNDKHFTACLLFANFNDFISYVKEEGFTNFLEIDFTSLNESLLGAAAIGTGLALGGGAIGAGIATSGIAKGIGNAIGEDYEDDEDEFETYQLTKKDLREFNAELKEQNEEYPDMQVPLIDIKNVETAIVDEDGITTITYKDGKVVAYFNEEGLYEVSEDGDYEDFDESLFENLLEKYINQTYDNIEKFKTNKAGFDADKKTFIIEGVLSLKNGKKGNSKFVFEDIERKENKVVMKGYNETFSKSKKAFKLSSKLEEKKLKPISLNYNYAAKNLTESKRVYGRVILK